MHRSLLVLLLALALSPSGVQADEKPAAEQPPKPLTDKQAADAVLKAVRANDQTTLKALAEKDEPDPWLVADELTARGKLDLALAYARAATRKDIERLPAYLVAEGSAADPDLRQTLMSGLQLRSTGDARGVLAALGDVPPNHDGVPAVRCQYCRGWALFTLRRYEESAEVFLDTAMRAEKIGWLRKAAEALSLSARDYSRVMLWKKALLVLRRLLALSQDRADQPGTASALADIAYAQLRLTNFEKALSFRERALAVYRELKDGAGEARQLEAIGVLQRSLGVYAKAFSFFERSLQTSRDLDDGHAMARTTRQIGLTYEFLGDWRNAMAFYERELALLQAADKRADMPHTILRIGHMHRALGDREAARRLYERSLELAKEQDLSLHVGLALESLARIHRDAKDLKTALALYRQAGEQYRLARFRPFELMSLLDVAEALADLGDLRQAIAVAERALEEMEKMDGKMAKGLALRFLGDLHVRKRDWKTAEHFFNRALGLSRSVRNRGAVALTSIKLARMHLTAGSAASALLCARLGLAEIEFILGGLAQGEGATSREQFAELFGAGTLAAARVDDLAAAVEFLEYGRAGAMLDALGKREALRWKAESLPPDLKREDQEAQAAQNVARHRYDRAIKRSDLEETRRAAKALDDATDIVRAVAGRIQRELKQQAGLFYPRAKTLYDIQDALEADQALVLYGLCLDEALALVLRQDGERIVSLGTVADVEALCEALDATDPGADPTKALAMLKALLVDPLNLGKDVKQVLVSPEGLLCYLPFGALFDQTVAMTPSGTTHVLLLDEEREPGKGVLSLGNPDYSGISEGAKAIYFRGRQLSPLPATGPEAEAVGTTTLLGAKATEAGLREAVPKTKRWKAIHFACHGLIDVERPMLSSLALSSAGEDDGFLTALEVLRMQIPADLAVLSACETGTGKVVKGEGILGLTRAFMFAGSPRVICSLWKVDDAATQALMIKFYELWNPKPEALSERSESKGDGKKGLGAAAALKKAQAYVRDFRDERGKQKWKHPYYWAAWVLWGLPE